MRAMKTNTLVRQIRRVATIAAVSLLASAAHAAAPGITVTATDGSPGLLAQEAAAGSPVTYSFVASNAGTHSYYSGTQSDLPIEMGLYGAIIVLPSSPPGVCTAGLPTTNPGGNAAASTNSGEADFRLAR